MGTSFTVSPRALASIPSKSLNPLGFKEGRRGANAALRNAPNPEVASLTFTPTNIRPTADAIRLANLLENAIKYAPDNANILISSIEVSRQVLIKVQDDGPGIPNDKLEDVIERFVRLDATRSSPGSGLGLSMVRAIAKVHQGALTLNNLRNGFVATIALPV